MLETVLSVNGYVVADLVLVVVDLSWSWLILLGFFSPLIIAVIAAAAGLGVFVGRLGQRRNRRQPPRSADATT
jgi:hypothetical protein